MAISITVVENMIVKTTLASEFIRAVGNLQDSFMVVYRQKCSAHLFSDEYFEELSAKCVSS